MNKLADNPAFPQAFLREYYDDGRPHTDVLTSDGMTLRQFAAIHAMQGLLADPNVKGDPEQVATVCVAYSDALLAELAKTTSQSC